MLNMAVGITAKEVIGYENTPEILLGPRMVFAMCCFIYIALYAIATGRIRTLGDYL